MIRALFTVLDMVGVACFSTLFLIFLTMKFWGTSTTTEVYVHDEHTFLNTMLILTGAAIVVLVILALGPLSPVM